MSESKYPKDSEIKVEWTLFHYVFLLVCTLLTWGMYIFSLQSNTFQLSKLFSILGLYIDIIGVVVASLKTPFFGLFVDGGEVQMKCAKVENIWFQRGMFIIALGMLFQIVGSLL